MKNPRSYLPWVLIGLLWLVFLALALLIYTTHPNGAGDFDIYYRGAQRVLQDIDLYANLASNDYVGPPLVVQLIAPLAALVDYKTAAVCWFFINAALILGSLAAIIRYLPSNRQRLTLVAAATFFGPTLITLWWGQSSPLVFALTTGAWVAYKERRPSLTGILLATAVWTKFYPGLFLVYFLWKREWRVVISAGIATAAVVVLQMLISGADTFIYYFTDVLPELFAQGQPALVYASHSLLSFLQRLFIESAQVQPLVVSPVLFSLSRLTLTFGFLAATIYAVSRPANIKNTRPETFDLEYGLILLTAQLMGSTLGTYSLLSVLLVYGLVLRNTPRAQTRRVGLWLFLSGTLITLHPFIIVGYLQPPSDNTLPALALSTPFFGMVLLWGMVVWLLSRQRAAV